ncbi:MAG: CotH kinase family protein, partial [Proteobacteria bacterium]|nr:CotH kinase family protein [Pseudomonadota bacterium]
MRHTLLVGAIVMGMGCGGDPTANGVPDAGVDATPPDAYVDLSGPVFEPDHIVDVAITMAAADWDALRAQTRTVGSVIEGDCLAQPIPSPFTTFAAAITVDGTSFPNVGVKKKGFLGSLDPTKPSLKVKFDEFVSGAEYLGLEKLTLNNSHQDPSYVRQCLAYQTFAAAGIVAPRCNFAHVHVNGTDLGVYVNVESIDHNLTKKRYPDGTGPLYEGSLSDFRTTWVNTLDPKGAGDRSDLAPLVAALESATDANLVAAISPYLDVDRFMTYWAMELITNHWDGYANDRNNFFVYHDPTTGKLDFIPWGVDATFQPGATFGPLGATNGPVAIAAAGILAHRLFAIPQTRQQILDRERSLLASLFDEAHLLAEITRMETLIAPIADAVEGPGWHAVVTSVRGFVTNRRARLTAALDAGPTWTDPLAGYPCLDVAATVDGTFDATYGTLGNADPLHTGTGTFTITIGGIP